MEETWRGGTAGPACVGCWRCGQQTETSKGVGGFKASLQMHRNASQTENETTDIRPTHTNPQARRRGTQGKEDCINNSNRKKHTTQERDSQDNSGRDRRAADSEASHIKSPRGPRGCQRSLKAGWRDSPKTSTKQVQVQDPPYACMHFDGLPSVETCEGPNLCAACRVYVRTCG